MQLLVGQPWETHCRDLLGASSPALTHTCHGQSLFEQLDFECSVTARLSVRKEPWKVHCRTIWAGQAVTAEPTYCKHSTTETLPASLCYHCFVMEPVEAE